MTRFFTVLPIFCIIVAYAGAQEVKIGDIEDANRSRAVHVIRLIDHDSSTIWLDEQPLLPFSTKNTCGECHDYSRIASGWHFNAGTQHMPAGRAGQPWIYGDPFTLTQIPMSYRDWPGCYHPADLGIAPFDFVRLFGRHAAGGGPGEKDSLWHRDNIMRWRVSGPSEVNCLSCHDAEPAYDQSEGSRQMLRQNFRWAPTAASAIAIVTGSAMEMPDNYDIYRGTAPDEPQKQPPRVIYDPVRFNPQNKVFFDITTKIPDEKCFFCHSAGQSDQVNSKSKDVHLKAGLGCVDCHSNGLDHMIDRGDEPLGNSCRNCHLNTGKYGAPKPEHAGLPPVHFIKLACTTCHSGPVPEQVTRSFKTSMAHALGIHGNNNSSEAMPHIEAPVYTYDESGALSPHYLIWPAYWAEISHDSLVPLNPLDFRPVIHSVIGFEDSLGTGNWPMVTDSMIYSVLDTLARHGHPEREPVYVGQGRILRRAPGKKLVEIESGASGPVLWPLAHDVRPALQSLGSKGCDTCHDGNAPLFFGHIRIDGPLPVHNPKSFPMSDLQQQSSLQRRIFAASFLFRPWLKGLMIGITALTILILCAYFLRGINAVIYFLRDEEA